MSIFFNNNNGGAHTLLLDSTHPPRTVTHVPFIITVIIVERHNRIQPVVDADKRQSMHG